MFGRDVHPLWGRVRGGISWPQSFFGIPWVQRFHGCIAGRQSELRRLCEPFEVKIRPPGFTPNLKGYAINIQRYTNNTDIDKTEIHYESWILLQKSKNIDQNNSNKIIKLPKIKDIYKLNYYNKLEIIII